MFGGAGANLESLVAEIKELQKTNAIAKAKWNNYTISQGGGNRDPSRHTAEFLSEFLTTWQTTGPGDLVTQVKELQKSDIGNKEAWAAYTDAHGEGNRDPSRHTQEFLQAFLTSLQSGEKINSEAAGSFLLAIKCLQGRSSNFKSAWQHFCSEKGKGLCDPAKHDMAFYLQFFEDISRGVEKAQRDGMMGGGMGMMGGMGMFGGGMGMSGAPAAKRARTVSAPVATGGPAVMVGSKVMTPPGGGGGSAMGGMMGAKGGMKGKGMAAQGGKGAAFGFAAPQAGNGNAAVLVERIKAYQRMGEGQKQLWIAFAKVNCGGKLDPAAADPTVLSRFIVANEVPAVGAGTAAAPAMAANGKGGARPGMVVSGGFAPSGFATKGVGKWLV